MAPQFGHLITFTDPNAWWLRRWLLRARVFFFFGTAIVVLLSS